jgi:sigma-B regulation protein RsbU (phosphoserine phosphatase)
MKRDFDILVVDDSRTNRMLLVRYLQRDGFATIEADSATAALAILERQLPDLILLDIVMPDMSGFDLCGKLKRCDATRDIPVVFLTALDTPEDKVKGLELGAVDFITKPFDPPEVTARVRTQAAMHRMMQTILETNDRLARDLHMARRVQLNFLPARDTVVADGIAFDYTYRPCDELGGDFFSILPLDANRVLFYISDVSGHGVASALITIFTQTFLGTHAAQHPDPAELLACFNRQFIAESLGDKYVGTFLAILDLAAGELVWSSAGMTAAPILYREGEAETLVMESFPIGLVPGATYVNRTAPSPPGTSVLMYSDGLTDISDANGLPVLDEEGLVDHARANATLSQADMIQSILTRIEASPGEETYPDDLTVFLVTRT